MESFIAFVREHQQEILRQTYQHLWITSVALFMATVTGVLLGILLTRYVRLASPVLGFVNIIQTIPSIALLGFLLPLLGIGVVPAIVALFLYALLPIVRNTYTGIQNVDAAVVEAARGLGMSQRQMLGKVKLPLAAPVIFAGIRTAMVINIGVATLCALIAAGGLGEYIFRGIAVNNVNMILAGAVPASLLAIVLDALLSLCQRHIQTMLRPLLAGGLALGIIMAAYALTTSFSSSSQKGFLAGFNSEFMEREDGYPGFVKAYGFSFNTREMEIGLMYEALRSERVDVISGFSTDGRIQAYGLRVLEDDKQYFPPYFAAPLLRKQTLAEHPALAVILNQLKISEADMMQMNYAVDQQKRAPREVAREFLTAKGFHPVPKKSGRGNVVVGSKNFTENFILAEMFAALIESESQLVVDIKLGFGSTKLLMDAIRNGHIDIYPEYTGTALLVMLQPEKQVVDSLLRHRDEVYAYVKEKSEQQFNLTWLQPLGFNNTTALMMREQQAKKMGVRSISDLKRYLLSGQ